MKKLLCLAAALALLLPALSLSENDDFFKTYPLSPDGEAIVNDVDFSHLRGQEGNARVFYEIFVGSFSDSDGDGTGDLRGIIQRMDYLSDGDPASGLSLGIGGIWLTPIFSSPSYHKYDVTDFYTIDPTFGTMDDLRELIKVCHERDVKLILDLPINHTGAQNRWFRNFLNAHQMQNPRNDYYDFYVWREQGESLPAGRRFALSRQASVLFEANFSDSMPEPDFDQPFVRKTLLDVAKYYLDLGVDGFRFDAAKYIYLGDNAASAAFWEWYVGELRNIKPDVYTVAEVWDGEGVIDQYVPFTNCFNFTTSQVGGLYAETAKAGDVNRLTAYTEKTLDKLHCLNENAMIIPFIANHDTDRAAGYLTVAGGQMKVAANLYLLSPGSPFIYYGEEIGLRGSRGGANTDANRRLAMLWGDGDSIQDPPGATYDPSKQTPYSVQDLKPMATSLYNYYKTLIMLRRANPEIALGEYRALPFTDTKVGGFTSAWDGATVAVIHNTSARTAKLDLSAVTDLSFTSAAFVGMGQGKLENSLLTLEGQTSVILR